MTNPNANAPETGFLIPEELASVSLTPGSVVANAGEAVTFSGTVTPYLLPLDTDAATYTWSLRSVPVGSAAALSDTVGSTVTLQPDVRGLYEVALEAALPDPFASTLAVPSARVVVADAWTETFEAGFDSSRFGWSTSGAAAWTLTEETASSGQYALLSGGISHDEESAVEATLTLEEPSEIAFARRVSSEEGYDYLRFYINGELQAQWSGEVAWGVETFPLDAGEHMLRWAYEKDESVSEGSDAAWIDDVLFPVPTSAATSEVRLTSVADGAKVASGLDVLLEADVSPADAAARVAFYAGETLIGEDTDGADGWGLVWSGIASGEHALSAIATATGGAQVASDTARVTVGSFSKKTGTVVPIFECVAENADGTLTARFGYENYTEGATVVVPHGSQNKLTPSAFQGEQVAAFPMPRIYDGRPGRTAYDEGAFAVTFNPAQTSNVVWKLLSRTSTAGASSKRCPDAAQKASPGAPETLPDVLTATAYPNPFNPSATIRFALPEAAEVRLVVYDVMGREVARLVEGQHEAGFHEARFDGTRMASGTYLYRLEAASAAGRSVRTGTMLLVK